MLPAYTVIIPTYGRSALLQGTLASFAAQTFPATRVVVVDAAAGSAAAEICRAATALPLEYRRASRPSAALQRNEGAADALTPLVAFCDDDMTFGPRTMAALLTPFTTSSPAWGGIAARIEGFSHPVPSRALRAYYRWQAGYDHPNYGARLFGPAINCWPCYTPADGELIPADWLNSALVAYRTDVFRAEQFPAFEGYSYMEDVHLSARIARRHPLAFHHSACAEHHGVSTSAAVPRADLVEMQWRNRARIAREILGVPARRLRQQLRAHRAFVGLFLLRQRPPGWRTELAALARMPALA
jgi:glycosyltransferase involved in cell wall biosynthesis